MSLPAGSLIIYKVAHLAASPHTPYRIELTRSVGVISHQSQLGPHHTASRVSVLCICQMQFLHEVSSKTQMEIS